MAGSVDCDSWSEVVGTTKQAVILQGPESILMYSERDP